MGPDARSGPIDVGMMDWLDDPGYASPPGTQPLST